MQRRREQEPTSGLFTFGQVLPVMLLAVPFLVITMEAISAIDHHESGDNPSPDRRIFGSSTTAQAHWEIRAPPPHTIGIRWAILLILWQASFCFVVSMMEYLQADKGPSEALRLLIPWYLITLPSAVYFMALLGFQWRRCHRFIIFLTFLVLAAYSTATWPVSTHAVMLHMSWNYFLPSHDTAIRGTQDFWKCLLLQIITLAVLLSMYIFGVLVVGLVRKGSSLRASRCYKL